MSQPLDMPDFDSLIRRCTGPDSENSWLNARDLVREMEYKSFQNMMDKLHPDDKSRAVFETSGGPQSMAIIRRDGALKLCRASGKFKAAMIARWIEGEARSFDETRQPEPPPSGGLVVPSDVFNFDGHQVRTVIGPDGKPWWIASDVCAILDLENVSMATSRLMEGDRFTLNLAEGSGHTLNRVVINESGLWDLVLESRKPEAKRFRQWLTAVVIPALRAKGYYSIRDAVTPAPESDPVLATLASLTTIRQQQLAAEVRQVQAERRLTMAEEELKASRQAITAADSKAEAALAVIKDDTKFMALVGWNKLHKLGMTRQEIATEGLRIANHCRRHGIEIKHVSSEVWGQVNVYPTYVLERWQAHRNGSDKPA